MSYLLMLKTDILCYENVNAKLKIILLSLLPVCLLVRLSTEGQGLCECYGVVCSRASGLPVQQASGRAGERLSLVGSTA